MPEFRRPRHRVVWQVLEALDPQVLESAQCYFGGGTRIVLELGEYRDSMDVDFLCSDRAGYRLLRSMVTQRSFGTLFRDEPELLRDIRADMYGIRTYLQVGAENLKFEIVSEGRIDLDGTSVAPFPVPLLSHASCFAEKLLANADRGRDAASRSRDIIDLAFMCARWSREDLNTGVERAINAYGDAVHRELRAALARIGKRQHRSLCSKDLAVSDARTLTRGLSILQRL